MSKIIIDSKNVGILIKVFEDQYIDEAAHGKIHFGPLQQYADIEEKDGDQLIGDLNEGKVVNRFKATKTWIRKKGDTKPIQVNINSNLKFTYGLKKSQLNHIGISCFTFLSLDDFQRYKQEGEKTFFEINPEVFKQIRGFIQYKEKKSRHSCDILLFNPIEMIDALDKQELPYGLVQYYDPNNPTVLKNLQESKLPTYFYKSDKYVMQREFRIVTNLNEGKGKTITIDGLSGIRLSWKHLPDLAFIADGLRN